MEIKFISDKLRHSLKQKNIITDFLQVVPLNGCGRQLLSLLNNIASKKERKVFQFCKMEEWEQGMEIHETRSLRFSCKRDSGNVLQKVCNFPNLLYIHL